MRVSFYVEVDQVEEDADTELLRRQLEVVVKAHFAFNDVEVACADH